MKSRDELKEKLIKEMYGTTWGMCKKQHLLWARWQINLFMVLFNKTKEEAIEEVLNAPRKRELYRIYKEEEEELVNKKGT